MAVVARVPESEQGVLERDHRDAAVPAEPRVPLQVVDGQARRLDRRERACQQGDQVDDLTRRDRLEGREIRVGLAADAREQLAPLRRDAPAPTDLLGQASLAGRSGRGVPLIESGWVRIEEVLHARAVVAREPDAAHHELVGGAIDPELFHDAQWVRESHSPASEELGDQRNDVDWVWRLDRVIVRSLRDPRSSLPPGRMKA